MGRPRYAGHATGNKKCRPFDPIAASALQERLALCVPARPWPPMCLKTSPRGVTRAEQRHRKSDLTPPACCTQLDCRCAAEITVSSIAPAVALPEWVNNRANQEQQAASEL